MRLLFTETENIIMTPDKKCILRGNSKYNMTICLVDEPSKLKVKHSRNGKAMLQSVQAHMSKSWSNIKMTDAVRKLYNTDKSLYKEDELGELIAVKVEAKFSIKENS